MQLFSTAFFAFLDKGLLFLYAIRQIFELTVFPNGRVACLTYILAGINLLTQYIYLTTLGTQLHNNRAACRQEVC